MENESLMEVELRLGHPLETLHPTLHNGPGWRIALWVQGCSILCTRNCLNPHLLSRTGGHAYSIAEIVKKIGAVCGSFGEAVEGITLLGGEPTDQAAQLVPLFTEMRRRNLSTMLYSGYALQYLRRCNIAGVHELLAQTDLLVDGPFIDALYQDDLPWRGSSNQKIHCLTAHYSLSVVQEAYCRQGKGYSLRVTPAGDITVGGLQERSSASAIEKLLDSSNF